MSTQLLNSAPTKTGITRQEIQAALPANLKNAATDSLVAMVNNVTVDEEMAKTIRDGFISYTSVLKEGRFKIDDYLNAVTYVSYLLMGDSNKEAYCKTFPQRHAELVARNEPEKVISAYVSMYNKNKLVNLIREQSLVPSWVLNQDIYQKAINEQYTLMTTANSEKVRSDAANSLLTHLKKPEGKDFQINIDARDTSGMTEMKEALRDMAQMQRNMLENGANIKTVTDSKLFVKEEDA